MVLCWLLCLPVALSSDGLKFRVGRSRFSMCFLRGSVRCYPGTTGRARGGFLLGVLSRLL